MEKKKSNEGFFNFCNQHSYDFNTKDNPRLKKKIYSERDSYFFDFFDLINGENEKSLYSNNEPFLFNKIHFKPEVFNNKTDLKELMTKITQFVPSASTELNEEKYCIELDIDGEVSLEIYVLKEFNKFEPTNLEDRLPYYLIFNKKNYNFRVVPWNASYEIYTYIAVSQLLAKKKNQSYIKIFEGTKEEAKKNFINNTKCFKKNVPCIYGFYLDGEKIILMVKQNVYGETDDIEVFEFKFNYESPSDLQETIDKLQNIITLIYSIGNEIKLLTMKLGKELYDELKEKKEPPDVTWFDLGLNKFSLDLRADDEIKEKLITKKINLTEEDFEIFKKKLILYKKRKKRLLKILSKKARCNKFRICTDKQREQIERNKARPKPNRDQIREAAREYNGGQYWVEDVKSKEGKKKIKNKPFYLTGSSSDQDAVTMVKLMPNTSSPQWSFGSSQPRVEKKYRLYFDNDKKFYSRDLNKNPQTYIKFFPTFNELIDALLKLNNISVPGNFDMDHSTNPEKAQMTSNLFYRNKINVSPTYEPDSYKGNTAPTVYADPTNNKKPNSIYGNPRLFENPSIGTSGFHHVVKYPLYSNV